MENTGITKRDVWTLTCLIFLSFLITLYSREMQQRDVIVADTLTSEEALLIVKDKYKQAQRTYQIIDSFYLSKGVINIGGTDFREISDYDEVISQLFTKRAKEQFEKYYDGAILKQDNKVYFSQSVKIDNFDDTGITFIPEKINNHEIKYIAKSKRLDSQTGMVLTTEEDTFSILNAGDEWLVDHIVLPNQ